CATTSARASWRVGCGARSTEPRSRGPSAARRPERRRACGALHRRSRRYSWKACAGRPALDTFLRGLYMGPARRSPSETAGRLSVKILVPVKRVADPDNANKMKVSPDGAQVTSEGLEWKINPFDEYAVEAALRLNEKGGTN